jgi:hypothetical protein
MGKRVDHTDTVGDLRRRAFPLGICCTTPACVHRSLIKAEALSRYDNSQRLRELRFRCSRCDGTERMLLLFDELIEVNDFIYPDRWP